MKKTIILVLAVILFSGCEKDDICDANTVTTPRLVVEFYDISNPTTLKNVVSLKVTGDGMTDALNTYNGVSKIKLPLKTTEDITKYSFVLNSADENNDNEDVITINYARLNQFVSRACGYKTIFGLVGTTPITYSEPTIPDGSWIQELQIITPTITSENETHVKILF